VLAPPAASMRLAVECASAFSALGAALVLATGASAVRDAVVCVALSRLEAALGLAAFAPAVRLAVPSVASIRLGATLILAPLAPAMSSAVRCAATNSRLGAALQLTLPPAHGPPHSSRHTPRVCTLLLCCAPFTATTHPLSALIAPLVHIGHHAHDGGSARAGQTLGLACLDPDGQQRLGGGRTVGV
jgi:hypothetical protein